MNAHRFAPAAPDESYVYGACTPGWHSAADREAARDDWIAFMQREGIERVCCLLTGCQLDDCGQLLDTYQTAFGEANVCHVPVRDHHLLPEDRLAEEILPFLAQARSDEARVVVHSLAGIGRTGQALAAWLVYNRDYGPERAIATVQEQGRDPMAPVEAGNAEPEDVHALLGTVARL